MRIQLKLCTLKLYILGRTEGTWMGLLWTRKGDQTHKWNTNVSKEKLSARHLTLSSYNAGCEGEEQAVTPPPYPPRAREEMQAPVPHSKA